MGDSLGTDHFWHGAILNKWAEDWVRLYTRGTGSMAIADCEDQGILLAMTKLGQLGKVDTRASACSAHGKQLHRAAAGDRPREEPVR